MSSTLRGWPRRPAHAGTFYPGTAPALSRVVRQHLAAADTEPLRRLVASGVSPHAILVPHAGYIYSGPTAAVAVSAVTRRPGRVVMVGPGHRVRFRGISAADFSSYEVPGGSLPVDREALATLEAAGLARFVPEAHVEEHCLEVMIPWLLERFPGVAIVPLLVGAASHADVDAALSHVLRPDDLVLVSSDLSHFHPYDVARRLDLATLEAVRHGDAGALDGRRACGHIGLGGLLTLAARQGWEPCVLDYRSSGDTAGDRDRVVGYGAAAFV